MITARLLVGLYPAPVRERWGADLSAEITRCGPRSWADTVLGAIRLWMQPATWPEIVAGQVRRTVAGFAVAVVAAAALGARGFGGSALGLGTGHPVTALWAGVLAIGLAVLAPVPRFRLAALARLAAHLAQAAALPAALLMAMIVSANSGLIEHPGPVARFGLVAFYWSTLVLTGVRAATSVGRLQPEVVRLPGVRRIQFGLLLVAGGLTVGAGQTVTNLLVGGGGATSGIAAALFTALAALSVQTVLDLRANRTV